MRNVKEYSKVKIFGERNTSTNAMKEVIEVNSAARVLPSSVSEIKPGFFSRTRKIKTLVFGTRHKEREIDRVFAEYGPAMAWKHCATNFDSTTELDDTLVLFAVRDPYSWIYALARRPYHSLRRSTSNLSRFVETEWQTVARDRLNCRSMLPLELYQEKLRSYQSLIEKLEKQEFPYYVYKFEDFVFDQIQTFSEFSSNLSQAAENPKPVIKSTKEKDKTSEHYKNYYSKEIWKNDYPDAARIFITQNADWELFAGFGYSVWEA